MSRDLPDLVFRRSQALADELSRVSKNSIDQARKEQIGLNALLLEWQIAIVTLLQEKSPEADQLINVYPEALMRRFVDAYGLETKTFPKMVQGARRHLAKTWRLPLFPKDETTAFQKTVVGRTVFYLLKIIDPTGHEKLFEVVLRIISIHTGEAVEQRVYAADV